jgi:hypothetical protein
MKFSENKANLKYGADNTRTVERLDLIESLGLKLVGLGDFGIPHVFNGLYIEKVWNDSDTSFNAYIEWLKNKILDKITEKVIEDTIMVSPEKALTATLLREKQKKIQDGGILYLGAVAVKIGQRHHEDGEDHLIGVAGKGRYFPAVERLQHFFHIPA